MESLGQDWAKNVLGILAHGPWGGRKARKVPHSGEFIKSQDVTAWNFLESDNVNWLGTNILKLTYAHNYLMNWEGKLWHIILFLIILVFRHWALIFTLYRSVGARTMLLKWAEKHTYPTKSMWFVFAVYSLFSITKRHIHVAQHAQNTHEILVALKVY